MLSYLRTSLFSRLSSLSLFSTTASAPSSTTQHTVMSAKDLVDKAIAGYQIAIFSKSWCPFCKRAKELLKKEYPDAQSITYELDEMKNGDEIQGYLLEKTGQRTVPNIFVAQQHIGGCDDTMAAQKAGRIATLLKN